MMDSLDKAPPGRLHVTHVGTGPVPAVFLHGLFGQGRNFASVARNLGDLATWALIDLPNHGRSPWTDFVDYDAMALAVAAEVARMPHPVHLVGHSLGGRVAMRLALHHPRLVSGLTILDATVDDRGFDPRGFDYLRAMRVLPLYRITTREEADAELARACPDAAVRALLLQNLRRTPTGWAWQINVEALAHHLRSLATWPPAHGTYSGSVAWVIGERSDRVSPADAPAMRVLFPSLRVTVVKQAGHWVHVDAPVVVAQILRDELSRRSPSSH